MVDDGPQRPGLLGLQHLPRRVEPPRRLRRAPVEAHNRARARRSPSSGTGSPPAAPGPAGGLDHGEVVTAVREPQRLGDLVRGARVVGAQAGARSSARTGRASRASASSVRPIRARTRAPMLVMPALPQWRSGAGAIHRAKRASRSGQPSSRAAVSASWAPSWWRSCQPSGSPGSLATSCRECSRAAVASVRRPRATRQRAWPEREYTAQASRPSASASSASRANRGTARA